MKNNLEKKRTLTPLQVEEMYGIPVGTLRNMRFLKRGPKYFILGNIRGKRHKILYFIEDLEKWIRQNPVLTFDSLPEEKLR